MLGGFFEDVVDNTKGTIDGVVNTQSNQVANSALGTGMGYADDVLYGASDFIGNAATGLLGENIGGFVGDIATGAASIASNALFDAINSSDIMSAIRSFDLFGTTSRSSMLGMWKNQYQYDWRVKLSIPPVSTFSSSQILKPLRDTDNALVWPYTPNIIVTSNANYNSLSPTHNNYTYPAYQNSSVDQITITGEFSVENAEDAAYWVAANHYLRSVTKMFYGNSSNLGAPPPVVRLNGYGDFVFSNVPVVIESFMINLPKDVDYIKANIGPNGSWVPTLSEVSVTVRVAYSRADVNQFSLDSFVNGQYLGNTSPGFI